MKSFSLFILSLCFACIAKAQVAPRILGENHALVSIKNAGALLMLPVQESEHNAHIRILQKGNLMQTINIRLAVDKIDYYVPYTVSGGELFDIAFEGDRHKAGTEIKHYLCWQKMHYADAFDCAREEPYRPLYHHAPQWGWMNDPNGMFYKDGVWHLCYQWNPYASYWENLSWGHSSSTDLIHWKAEPKALADDALGMIFSGSAVVDKDNTAGFGRDAIVAYYTSARSNQTQCMAVSTDDGKTFEKAANNPILTAATPDFRDPKLIWHEGTKRWIMVLAVGQEMHFYSSANLKDWAFESAFGKEYGCHEGVWECPDLMEMPVEGTNKSQWMLVCNINPGGPFGGSATQYFTGDFDGHRFTCDSKATKWMDYGKDHYATVCFSDVPDGRHVALPWMSNWQYAAQVPTLQYRSANGLARELGLYAFDGNTYCSVVPAKEYANMRGNRLAQPAKACEIEATLRGDATLTLTNDKGEKVVISYDAAKQELSMDRRESGVTAFSENFPALTTAPTRGSLRTLRIFIDSSSIEIFSSNGHVAMTNLVFPTLPYNRLVVKGKAKATIYSVKL